MTLRLTVRRLEWTAHVRATAAAYGSALLPVVKGNGYGFGRTVLHEVAAGLATQVCVGTVHEVHDVPAGLQPVVLTPTLHPPAAGGARQGPAAVLTVGHAAHVAALRGRPGPVVLKLGSSMRRYGVEPNDLPALQTAATDAGLEVVAYALHLPLAGTDAHRRAEIESWLARLPADGVPLWVSHLSPESFHALAAAHPHRPLRIRVGTALWHGAPRGDFLHLSADVQALRPVRGGEAAGYRLTPIPHDGTLVMVGCGSSHGVAPLAHDDPARRSPFHFRRHRLHLLEPPHMHTSMCIVPEGGPVPDLGDIVDVQQPLINVHPDELEWLP